MTRSNQWHDIPHHVRRLSAAAARPFWRFADSLCTTGLLLATLFFAASLTPSLVPRPWLMQGVLSGLSLVAGYGIGVGVRWLWQYLELPKWGARLHRVTVMVASVVLLTVALIFLWRAGAWQNAIRALMELPPVETVHHFRVGGVALGVFAAGLVVGRLFRLTVLAVAGRLRRFIPRRIANVAGALVALLLFWTVIDGLLFRQVLETMDNSFQQVDARLEPDVARPEGPLKTGSDASLIGWEGLGRQGRIHVSGGPDRDAIAELSGARAEEPLRVYVGLNSAATIEARAELALAEMRRVGAFERSALVLVTPTGSGWIDPSALDTVEYLHHGDIASVAVQYSYLPSWLSLLVEGEYGHQTARALFRTVYEHWTDLPESERPELYLHGLSLGALNSQRAMDFYDVIGDPVDGALWSGPPYRSEVWREITRQRRPGSPAWLPRFRDDSLVRFANQYTDARDIDAPWGPMRILFLQHASDPITFFEPSAFYQRPEWMEAPRGPDVADELRWFPIVTGLQLAVDVIANDTAPPGYGHVYTPAEYIDAWLGVSEPPGWTPEAVARLKTRHR
ncbi:MAG: alpha/beta hydrolase [Pseudomonadota bacterium]